MAGLSVVSSPGQFANTFGGNALQGNSVGLQGASAAGLQGGSATGLQGGNASALSAPKVSVPTTSTTKANVPFNPFANSVVGTMPSKAVVGPAPAYRGQASDGTIFTDPNAQAAYEVKLSQNAPVTYNGKQYTNRADYANAILNDAQTQHDQAVKQINTAHENGLISFDQQQKLIDQSRTNLKTQLQSTLDSQSGYFNNISPDAVQSQQGVMAGQANDQYNQGVGQIDTQQQNLGTTKTDFGTNYTNSLAAADKSLTGVQDQVANNATSLANSDQATLNAGQTAAANFQNSLASYNTSAANASQPTVTQFDPGQIATDAAKYVLGQKDAGQGLSSSIDSYMNSLAQKGVDVGSPQLQGLKDYIYGLFANKDQTPNRSNYYGSLYSPQP